jgi:hypothetical protein
MIDPVKHWLETIFAADTDSSRNHQVVRNSSWNIKAAQRFALARVSFADISPKSWSYAAQLET